MKKNRHSDERIVAILREVAASTVVATAKRQGVAEQTITAGASYMTGCRSTLRVA